MSYKEKVEVYEAVLHQINLYSSITMDSEKIGELIDAINAWSYAHRCGNGELSDEEQQALIDAKFNRLKEMVGK